MPAGRTTLNHQEGPSFSFMVDQEDQESPRRSEGGTPAIARLPLFSRCPITNKAKLEAPVLQVSAFKPIS